MQTLFPLSSCHLPVPLLHQFDSVLAEGKGLAEELHRLTVTLITQHYPTTALLPSHNERVHIPVFL